MTNHRILLFGGNGQVGQTLQRQAIPSDCTLRALTRAECDFLNPGDIARAIHDFEPHLVINAAAMTDIDACEKNPEMAREINFHAVAHIAGQCATVDAPFIQISTDYVFDGTEQDHAYDVDDPMNPLNVYGQTKMMGEEAARHGLYWHVIVRTSLVFSLLGDNVLVKTLKQIETQDEIRAVSDQKANPTSATAVAQGVIEIAKAILGGKGDGFGTFHLCGIPPVTRYEFLETIMDTYAPYTSKRPKLVPQLAATIANRVPRPASTALNADKLKAVYAVPPRNWRDDLAACIKEYVEQHR